MVKNAVITWAATGALFLLLMTGEVSVGHPALAIIMLAVCGLGLLWLGKEDSHAEN